MNEFIVPAAFALDLLLGDPRWFPHPVRLMGAAISFFEKMTRRFSKTARSERIAGVLLVLTIVVPSYLLTALLLDLAFSVSELFGFLVSTGIAYTTIAARDLADSARAVSDRLSAGDLEGARRAVSMIVGRDTRDLDQHGIARAAVESVAESSSDGVIAPIFYLALGGPALAMAYKAVNTLDSMVGYRNERYRSFGWAAARLDDLANYLPARLSALLLALSAGLLARRLGSAWRTALRDGRKHASLNSGYPEAAMAGGLGVQLGGPASYGGVRSDKPFLGEGYRLPGKKDIALSVRFMYCAALAAAALAVLAGHVAGSAVRLYFPILSL